MAVFSWFRSREQEVQPTRQRARRPISRDVSSGFTVNRDLTYGIYHNSYAGLKLAAGMGFPAIAIPVNFMGFPVAKSDDEELSEMINTVLEKMIKNMRQIHIESHRDGTIWIWPIYDSMKRKVVWEFIPDDSVQDVVRDLNTNEVLEIWTDEQLKIRTGKNRTANVRRIRHFTKTRSEVSFIGGTISSDLADRAQRNILGILPIAFANNQDGDEIRGHSDYERVISLFKAYHDISEAEYTTLAKFNAKMIQDVSNVDTWLANNGFDSISDIDIGAIDLVMNLPDKKEATEFVFADKITSEHREAKKQLFHQIVEASGIPEIIWGIKTTGNHASTEENMATLAQYVTNKQEQKTEAYRELFVATFTLEAMAQMKEIDLSSLTVEWNDLDNVSEKIRAEIFKNFATGLKELYGVAGITEKQAWKLWTALYPSATEDEFEDWQKGVREMAKFKQFSDASYIEALAAGGDTTIEQDVINIVQDAGNGSLEKKQVIDELKNYFQIVQ